MWSPIALENLNDIINKDLLKCEPLDIRIWELVKLLPQKWIEKEYGSEGGGFWVVAIFGNTVVWYNDIENGFNLSVYSNYGEIGVYGCDDYDLNHIISQIRQSLQL